MNEKKNENRREMDRSNRHTLDLLGSLSGGGLTTPDRSETLPEGGLGPRDSWDRPFSSARMFLQRPLAPNVPKSSGIGGNRSNVQELTQIQWGLRYEARSDPLPGTQKIPLAGSARLRHFTGRWGLIP